MIEPRKPFEAWPDTLPYPVTHLEPEARIQLLHVLLGSIANSGCTMSADTALETAHRSIEHFEAVTSALEGEQPFITYFDDILTVNGYTLRIYQPAKTD